MPNAVCVMFPSPKNTLQAFQTMGDTYSYSILGTSKQFSTHKLCLRTAALFILSFIVLFGFFVPLLLDTTIPVKEPVATLHDEVAAQQENIFMNELLSLPSSNEDVQLANSTVGAEAIHIVLLVADNPNPRHAKLSVCERVETLLKSILTFYKGQLHVHLLTNTRSGNILATLFRTWHVERVSVSLYNVEDDQKSLEWVKSTHEASGYGQLKYMISEILPQSVDRAIFIDSDMLVLVDISILHSYFTVMDQRGSMFATTIDNYPRIDLERSFGKGARKKSVNSGLVLYNIKAMRQGNWSSLWRDTGVMLMNKMGTLAAPQDLLAAVSILRPDTYMQLPCVYNFQIGELSLPWGCIKRREDMGKVKIPHWTGLKKYYETSGHSAVLAPIYRCFQKMEGYDFEEDNGQGDNYQTITYLQNSKRADTGGVTLVAHVNSADSIALIQRLNREWLGPISLAVCGSSWDRARLLSFLFAKHVHDLFDIHFVLQRRKSCPVNYLQRVAIDASRTPYALLADVLTTRVNDELRRSCAVRTMSQSTVLIRNVKTSAFVGALLAKSTAQHILAGRQGIEEGVKMSKLKFSTLRVEPADFTDNYLAEPFWSYDRPSDHFCQREIDRRREQ